MVNVGGISLTLEHLCSAAPLLRLGRRIRALFNHKEERTFHKKKEQHREQNAFGRATYPIGEFIAPRLHLASLADIKLYV